jgi:hypothetical protein
METIDAIALLILGGVFLFLLSGVIWITVISKFLRGPR